MYQPLSGYPSLELCSCCFEPKIRSNIQPVSLTVPIWEAAFAPLACNVCCTTDWAAKQVSNKWNANDQWVQSYSHLTSILNRNSGSETHRSGKRKDGHHHNIITSFTMVQVGLIKAFLDISIIATISTYIYRSCQEHLQLRIYTWKRPSVPGQISVTTTNGFWFLPISAPFIKGLIFFWLWSCGTCTPTFLNCWIHTAAC